MSPNQAYDPRKSYNDLSDKSKNTKELPSNSQRAPITLKQAPPVKNEKQPIFQIVEEDEYQPGFLDGELDHYHIKVKDSTPVSLHNIPVSNNSLSNLDSLKTDNKVSSQ